MKSKRMRLALMLIAVSLVFSLIACQQTPTTTGSGTTTTKAVTTTTGGATTTTAADEDPVDISIWYAVGRFTLEDRRDKIPFEKDIGFLEERFNIKLNYTTAPSEQARDQLGIMLATNSMTDIISMQGSFDTFLIRPDQMFADGQIIDLKSIEASIPTFMGIVDDNPVIMKNVMDDEDHILYFGMPIFEAEVGMSGGLMIRKDWLDKYDLDIPQSIDDFLNALRAFRDNDPNGNGTADEVPFCGN